MKFCSLAIVTLWMLLPFGALKAQPPNQPDSSATESTPLKAIAEWDFEEGESAHFRTHGNVESDQEGPRPPEFPEMLPTNRAVKLDAEAYLSVPDEGEESRFDFDNGDEITLEAWVNTTSIRDGQPLYVIGKGRTNSPKFARDNQNWALRLMGKNGEARLNFLFASKPSGGGQHWHRWTSTLGFPVATGWHHIAVTYRFGDPDSITGWLNGKKTDGTWDMGGATTKPPVVDDDAVWIGNRFSGKLDGIAIYRKVLADEVLAAKFHRIGKPRTVVFATEEMPDLGEVPDGQVILQMSEGMPSGDRWLYDGESWPAETLRWFSDAFLLSRIPVRYESWGIRSSWKAPVLLRIAGDIELPVGTHQCLLRARSTSRLWVDGQLVSRLKPARRRGGNLEPIVPVPDPLVPGARRLPFPQQEAISELVIAPAGDSGSRRVRVVLEVIDGRPGNRTESGEVCVAIQQDGQGPFAVLSADASAPLLMTDDVIESKLQELEAELIAFEDHVRREAATSQDEFWNRRHSIARKIVSESEAGNAFQPPSESAGHPVDRFVLDKIASVQNQLGENQTPAAKNSQEKVFPILQEQCFRCHGEKEQGGLRFNSRQGILSTGESGFAAVVPGDPEASELIARVRAGDMPPTESGLSEEQIQVLEEWVRDGAVWVNHSIDEESMELAPVVDDSSFVRRVYLDTVGVVPNEEEVRQFLADESPAKRDQLIGQLLEDDRYADHWVSFWMDLLAENPTLLNQSLNSTGPFRWFLHESLRDGKSLDRMVTELILMRGSSHEGGSAGFGLAGENDSPMAAKGHILASAFLGIEMQCARCHDSPYHSTKQEDLYSVAAMLKRQSLAPPDTSRVPDAFFEGIGRESLIEVSLQPGVQVSPDWPFAEQTGVADDEHIDLLVQNPGDSRERLAALITSPKNRRFSKVVVNHLWRRLLGAGIVQPVHDWEGQTASHPEMLEWLANELVVHDYDLRHVLKLIMTSETYQRRALGKNRQASAENRFFNAPDPRRLTAEQIVDSLFVSTGSVMDVGELTFTHDGSEPATRRTSLGFPRRAWMFAGLNNERDRPSLSFPRAQPVVDVLEAFGWTGTRQQPIFERDMDPNLLQPGILENGTLTMSLTRAAFESELADLAVEARDPDVLLDTLFLRFLSRFPNADEKKAFLPDLSARFEERIVSAEHVEQPAEDPPLPKATWSNHLVPEANEIQEERQRRVRRGPPADPRLDRDWREVYEDVIWSLVNDRSFVWIP
ncbi:Planctomycete cytochrome C [Thalassoglobus neptunius]|uniref:Planctomycete cytochrome C n=1 Tax=Thalassoglobus neptunius TaxID=1938619 RepID=A0A5C5VQ19_9PLAN|nr:DUF1553 domain-containing protein [Thalassoglobus neptunius]TWT40706.1 Planctomycete cytochrome C [Thalassoglobus neptunius]